jgi:hypothetical protein
MNVNEFNRLIRSQTLTVSFKNHWNLLAETTVAARSAPDEISRSEKWWCLLTEVRTVFEENPDA